MLFKTSHIFVIVAPENIRGSTAEFLNGPGIAIFGIPPLPAKSAHAAHLIAFTLNKRFVDLERKMELSAIRSGFFSL